MIKRLWRLLPRNSLRYPLIKEFLKLSVLRTLRRTELFLCTLCFNVFSRGEHKMSNEVRLIALLTIKLLNIMSKDVKIKKK